MCAQSWSANRTRDYAGEWFGDEHWCEVRGGEFLQGEKSCWHRIRESDLTLGFTIGRFLETKNIIYRSYYFFIMRCLSIKPQISNKHQFGHTHTQVQAKVHPRKIILYEKYHHSLAVVWLFVLSCDSDNGIPMPKVMLLGDTAFGP